MTFDRVAARHLLLKLADILDVCEVPFFLMQGTALGAYRDKDFTPTELDIDFGILQEHLNEKVDILLPTLLKNNFDVVAITRPFTKVRTLVARAGWIHADLVGFSRWNGKRFACSPDEPKHVLKPYAIVHEANLLETYQSLEFFGRTFRVPNPIETYLRREYDDWKTPREDHESRTRVYDFVTRENIPHNLLEHQSAV